MKNPVGPIFVLKGTHLVILFFRYSCRATIFPILYLLPSHFATLWPVGLVVASFKNMADAIAKIGTVRFAFDLCSYHGGAVLDVEYVREVDVWYQMDELKCIKQNALKMSYDDDYIDVGSLLSSIYGRTNKKSIEMINTWVASCESLRGLERFANRDFGEKRASARRRTIQVVLTAQHKMRADGVKQSDHVERVLSRLSEAFSQDYIRFAVIMGQADMLVVSSFDDCYCVDDIDIDDLQKIVPRRIFIRDVTFKTPSGKIQPKKEKSPRTTNGPSFCSGINQNYSNAQRDFIEMRFCF